MTYRELDEHAGYVTDAVKVDAYRRALQNVVRPGDTVIDLGCGTGLLGMLALEAGAARVVAVDSGPILEVARQTFARNGFADRVELHRKSSKRLRLSTPADVVVCDQIGGFAHEVGLTSIVRDLFERGVVKPTARMVPASFDLFVAAVSLPPAQDPLRPWFDNPTGLDFTPFAQAAMNTPYRMTVAAGSLISPGALAARLDATDVDTIAFDVATSVSRAGALTGILGYMRAHLDRRDGVSITNDPSDPGRFRRWHLYHPIGEPIEVDAGDEVTIGFRINQVGHLTTWNVSVNGRHHRAGSTFFGDFPDPLALFDPPDGVIPPLSAAGARHKAALEAIDAGAGFAEVLRMIEQDHTDRDHITQGHGDKFKSTDDARRYLRDLIATYCERP